MHWLMLLMYAFLYALVGSVIGIVYALLTGADMASFTNIVIYAGFFGPVVILVIVAFRKLIRESAVPITRAIYHTLLLTVAAPVLMHGSQLIAGALDAPKVARLFEVLKYWSIPLVFVTAVFYGTWRLVQHEERLRRASGAHGSSGGPNGTPPSGSGNPGGQPIAAQRVKASVSPDEPARGAARHHRGLLRQPRHTVSTNPLSGVIHPP